MIAPSYCAAVIWTSFHIAAVVSATDQLRRCTDGIPLCNCTSPPPFGLHGAGMRVRLTRRLARYIDGVNLSAHRVGDVFEVTRHEAELLVAEEWAVPVV